ncbi:Hypothetical predicted protein [Pelobates cultripes]|uniref:Uncharacterized protein n=1 Tax=Pelobates cultripes TaxID=61616 RepID=A0AAD1R5V0_PELCU|nr:Hypothetical predicted protein [Pelobates cultripes]
MGKTKRMGTAGTSCVTPARHNPGPMDEFLTTPQDARGSDGTVTPAPSSQGSGTAHSDRTSPATSTLSKISADIAKITASMLTRKDKVDMVAELRAVIREEITAVRRDLYSDGAARGRPGSRPSTERPIPAGSETAPNDFGIERAHRALWAPRRDGLPRKIICSLESFQLKEAIMQTARVQQRIIYMDSQVSLYQDLSTITLDARRALRPLTRMLQERRIPYKWGFPFSLQARTGNVWHIIRWPNDAPRFLTAAGLPTIQITNWILDGPPAWVTGPSEVAHRSLKNRHSQAPSTRGLHPGPKMSTPQPRPTC